MRFYISIILSFNFFIGLSQDLVIKDQNIVKLQFRESDGYLQMTTNEKKYLLYDGKNVHSISENDYISSSYENDLSFNGNTAYFNQDSVIVGATINDLYIFQDQLFIGTEDGVYLSPIPLELVGRKLFREDFKVLKNVIKIWGQKGNLIFLNTIDEDLEILFFWNPTLDQIRTIPLNNVNDLAADNYGNLWIATSNGLYKWTDFSKVKKNIPHFNLTHVEKNGTPHTINTKYLLNEKDKLEFNFSSVHLDRPDEVKIYYQLQKADAGDGSVYNRGEENLLEKEALFARNYIFQNYEEGKYTIRFYSKLDKERDHLFLPPISITIEKKKVSSFWWYLLGLIGIVSMLLYIATQRQNKFQSDIINQRDKLLLENKSLRYQQKALQLQMNPHFIFNVLNSINGLIAKGDNSKARKFINDFAQLMRTVLNQSRTDTISVDKEIKYLKNYLELEAMSRGDRFDFKIIVDPDIEDDMHIQPMIIQPFVENAIVHGFHKLENRGSVSVQFKLEKEDLKVIVEDNGVGRHKESISKHKSVGLQVVKERLGPNYSYSFEDLKNLDGSNAGTRVNIIMSIK